MGFYLAAICNVGNTAFKEKYHSLILQLNKNLKLAFYENFSERFQASFQLLKIDMDITKNENTWSEN